MFVIAKETVHFQGKDLLIKGNQYSLVKERGLGVIVKDETGEKAKYHKSMFEKKNIDID